MNERIRELAEQAGFNLGDMERHGVEPLFEKFAQLIGQECLELADSIRDGCDQDGENQQALGAAWVGIAIARHFGVEE
jgi:hypothetical protein